MALPEKVVKKGIALQFADAVTTGEITSNIRKGKKIITYDLNVELGWGGDFKGQQFTGSVAVTLSEDDDADVDCVCTVDCQPVLAVGGSALDAATMDRVMRKQKVVRVTVEKNVVPQVREAVALFLAELRDK